MIIDGEKLGKLSHTVGDYNCTHGLLYSEKQRNKTEYLFVYFNRIQDGDTIVWIAKYLPYWELQIINY